MQSGLGGPDGDIESVRDFREREPEVVVEDQHGSLPHGEATDPAVELVSIDDRMDVVRGAAAAPGSVRSVMVERCHERTGPAIGSVSRYRLTHRQPSCSCTAFRRSMWMKAGNPRG